MLTVVIKSIGNEEMCFVYLSTTTTSTSPSFTSNLTTPLTFVSISTFTRHTSTITGLLPISYGILVSGALDRVVDFSFISDCSSFGSRLSNHSGGVFSLAILPNENLASASSDSTCIIIESYQFFHSF
jgi:hypothetical protein